MKKLFSLLVGLLMFGTGAYAQDIQLNPGWNAVSTPAYLSDLTFSNGGEGISFTTLKDGSWISVPALTENIKPLEGFMVYNANSSTVTLTLDYKENPAPSESIWQKQLSRGWNLLGITTTDDPFKGIDATIFVDPTLGGRYTVSNGISNPELGEAYFVFVSDGSIYGGVNTTEVAVSEVVEEQPEAVESGAGQIENDNTESGITNNEIVSTPLIVWASPIYKEGIKKYINGNDIIITELLLKAPNGSERSVLNSFILHQVSGEKIQDVSDIKILVNGAETEVDNIELDNGDIIVNGLNIDIEKSGSYISIVRKSKPGEGELIYVLSNINGESKNIDFTTIVLPKK